MSFPSNSAFPQNVPDLADPPITGQMMSARIAQLAKEREEIKERDIRLAALTEIRDIVVSRGLVSDGDFPEYAENTIEDIAYIVDQALAHK